MSVAVAGSMSAPVVEVANQVDHGVDRHELFSANVRLTYAIASRLYCPPGFDRSDMAQHALLGLQRAALRFDPRRGTSFGIFAGIDQARPEKDHVALRQEVQRLLGELPPRERRVVELRFGL